MPAQRRGQGTGGLDDPQFKRLSATVADLDAKLRSKREAMAAADKDEGELSDEVLDVCLALAPAVCSGVVRRAKENWVPAGWGGGGFYYSAAFHPTRDGVLYMGGDVNGVYKSEDHGKTWHIINNGISGYGVFALAVDPKNPDTVWAATDEGLSKSTDAGENWRTIPKSGPKDLRLTGEKDRGVHNVAVDPTNGNIVYVGTPHGKIYKTSDAGENWTRIYQHVGAPEPVASMRMQFGNVNDAIFGGLWMPLKFPESIAAADATGVGFTVKSEALGRATSTLPSVRAPALRTAAATCMTISRRRTGVTLC